MTSKLAVAQMYPARGYPLRQPTFPNLERTSTLSFSKTSTLTAGSENKPECHLALFRSPVYPVWASLPLATGVHALEAEFELDAPLILPSDSSELLTFGNGFFNPIVVTTNVTQPTGAKPILGDFHGTEYVYIPYGVDMSINVVVSTSLSALPGQLRLFLDIYNPTRPDLVTISAVNLASSASPLIIFRFGNVPSGSWVKATGMQIVASSTGSQTIISILYEWATSFDASGVPQSAPATSVLLPWMEPMEFTSSTIPYSDTRATATSLKLTNVSKVLSKEGTVLAARVPLARADPWSSGYESAAFRQAHPKERYFAALEKGLYTFSIGDTASQNFQRCDGSGIPLFPLEGVEYTTMICCTDPNPSTASFSDATILAVESAVAIEFRNSSQLFPIGVSPFSLEEMHRSQLELFRIGPFHPANTPPSMAQVGFRASKPNNTNQNKQPKPRKQRKQKRPKPAPKAGKGPAAPPKKKGGLQMYLDSRKQ